MLRVAILGAVLAAGLLTLAAAPPAPRTLEVGPGKRYALPSAAAAAARDGDRIVIAPGLYADCAVWRANRLTIEGAADGVVVADRSCQEKGVFVVTGRDITVRRLTLARAHVPDNNGAGIRAEGPGLTVDGVTFLDNQNGILTGDGAGTLTVRNSSFFGNGLCRPVCAHGIYAGHIDRLVVEHSRFFETHEGHHIKSRARRTEITGCDIRDGVIGNSSYLIDIPNGGSVTITGNTLQKGRLSENRSAAIMLGAEGVTQQVLEILVADNSFRTDLPETALVENRTDFPASLRNNRIIGKVVPLRGPGSVD